MQKKKIFGKIAVIALLIFAVWFYRDSMQDILWGIRQITAKQIVICMILATIYFLLDGALILLAAREFNRKCRGKDAVATTFLCEFYRLITLGSGACFAETNTFSMFEDYFEVFGGGTRLAMPKKICAPHSSSLKPGSGATEGVLD